MRLHHGHGWGSPALPAAAIRLGWWRAWVDRSVLGVSRGGALASCRLFPASQGGWTTVLSVPVRAHVVAGFLARG